MFNMLIPNTEKIFYFINDKNKNIRWKFPSDLKYPTFLNLYNSSGIKGTIYKLIVKIVFKLKLQKYFVSGVMKGDLEKKYIKIIENLDGVNYSIFTGTAGENRKVVIEVNDGKNTKYFIKIPTTTSAKELVQLEKKNLKYLEQFTFRSFEIPKISYSDDETVAISNIKPLKIAKDDNFSSIHFVTLEELYANTSNKLSIPQVSQFNLSVKYIENLNSIQLNLNENIDKLKTNLLNLKEMLIQNKSEVVVSFAHCDFTPWNMYITKNKLYVYDWELANQNTPLLFDFFHYIFQQGVLVKHKKHEMIKQDLVNFLESKELRQIISKYKIDFNEYYGYYLFINISYYALKYATQKDLHVQAYWLIDVWNDALEEFVTKKGKIFERN